MEKKRKPFWTAFLSGLAAPALIHSAPLEFRIEIQKRKDLDSMRGDWQRVGSDFRKVIAREEASAAR